jgi:hypothetical protein
MSATDAILTRFKLFGLLQEKLEGKRGRGSKEFPSYDMEVIASTCAEILNIIGASYEKKVVSE